MTHTEMQTQMLMHRMSVNDLAMTIHITKDAAKKYISGKAPIPKWIAIYFEELNGKTGQNSNGEKP